MIPNPLRAPWQRACALADRTPETRNRAVDLLRAVSIFAVVVGHWLVSAPQVANGQLLPGHLLALQPWTQWLTWGFQVMPIFFLVGGYSNGSSWVAARAQGSGYAEWLRTRLERLVGPVLPVLLAWSALVFTAHLAGAPAELTRLASQAALVPVWFLAVYLGIVALVPVSQAAWSRFGLGSVVALVGAVALVDTLTFGLGVPAVRWLNYALVWGAIHQLGYAWRAGRLPTRASRAFAAGALALAALGLLVGLGPYPVAMIGVPGAELSNSTPPNLALLALGLFQSGVVLGLEPALRRFLRHRTVWSATVLVNGMIMTVYLWHMTAMLAVAGLALAAGGFGLAVEPGSAAWWLARPAWLAAHALVLAGLVGAFLRFEQRSAAGRARAVPIRRALTGSGLVMVGLALASVGGVAAGGWTGVRLWVVAQPLVGAALAGFGPLARRGR